VCCLSHFVAMGGETGTRNCIGLKSVVPFVTARFRPKLQRLWRIGREYHVRCLSLSLAVPGEVGRRKCLGLKSKVPFVTDRYRPNLLWLWRMWRECSV
jgi:hypothetical protein